MLVRNIIEKAEIAAGVLVAMTEPAWAVDAHPVTIEGNGWVVIFIILFFVAVIYLLIIGSMQAEERDGRLRRYGGSGEHGWFGAPGHSDDDDDDDGGPGNSNN
jgi:hypothetical protein